MKCVKQEAKFYTILSLDISMKNSMGVMSGNIAGHVLFELFFWNR